MIEWTLGDLLEVAKAARWFPETFPVDYPPTTSGCLPIDRIRELRNLVHPCRHLRERGTQLLTDQQVAELESLTLAICEHLWDKLPHDPIGHH